MDFRNKNKEKTQSINYRYIFQLGFETFGLACAGTSISSSALLTCYLKENLHMNYYSIISENGGAGGRDIKTTFGLHLLADSLAVLKLLELDVDDGSLLRLNLGN